MIRKPSNALSTFGNRTCFRSRTSRKEPKNFGAIEIEVHQIGVNQAAVDVPSLTNIYLRINHPAGCAGLFAGIPYMPSGSHRRPLQRFRQTPEVLQISCFQIAGQYAEVGIVHIDN
jgi:hypothetical protein